MTHQALNVEEFTEINEQIRTEKSRTVKIFLLKYKCILLFTFILLSFGQFLYIMSDKLSANSDLYSNLSQMSSSFSNFVSTFKMSKSNVTQLR